IFVKDLEHRFLLANQSCAAAVALTPAELIGKNDLELGLPEVLVKGDPARGLRGVWADEQEVIESGQAKHLVEEANVLAGQQRFFNTTKIPLRAVDGQVWGVLGFAHDITESKRAQAAQLAL